MSSCILFLLVVYVTKLNSTKHLNFSFQKPNPRRKRRVQVLFRERSNQLHPKRSPFSFVYLFVLSTHNATYATKSRAQLCFVKTTVNCFIAVSGKCFLLELEKTKQVPFSFREHYLKVTRQFLFQAQKGGVRKPEKPSKESRQSRDQGQAQQLIFWFLLAISFVCSYSGYRCNLY